MKQLQNSVSGEIVVQSNYLHLQGFTYKSPITYLLQALYYKTGTLNRELGVYLFTV
jgi:hypothetical protein